MSSIRKLPSGKYQVQIRKSGMKQITKSFDTKKNALAFSRTVEGDSEIQRKLGQPISFVISFKKLANLYMEQYTGKDRSTIGRLDYWCSCFDGLKVTEIDEFMVDDGLIELSERVTGSTVNRYKSTLSAVFIYFIRHPEYKRLGFKNPVRKESVSCYSENPAKERFLSKTEQKELLESCQSSHWNKLYLLVLMALTTGARKGELLALKWSDIALNERVATLATSKNGKPRLLPLTQPVVEELFKFRKSDASLVFNNTVSLDRPFDPKKAWTKALKDSGIGHIRFHDLRHTAASNLVKVGRSLFEVGTLLGHSSTSMTARYAHLAIEDTRNMVDSVMGELM
ncbi:MAG: site-specific integrase [Gammaproteobacteria bacterium]|nr:site-specific integrase [Gammaproteobacteria bacterium]